jgi:death-on-curing protein
LRKLVFLQLDEIIEIHNNQIILYGGRAGVRDLDLLKTAIAMPAAGFGGEYLHRDIYEMAAAYLFHIVRSHPFIDGNKRTGAVASAVFLMLNGIELQADEDSLEKLVISVAKGKMRKAGISKAFRNNPSPVGQNDK